MMHPKRISISISATATKVLAAVIFLLLMGGVTAHAQNQQKKMDAVTEDTIPLFRGMAVGVDIIGPVQLMVSDYGQYEASLRVNLKDKYYPIFELGYGKADASDESTRINYKTSAPYFRIGVDWNLLKNKHDVYRLFGGFRYGFTSFKYDVSAPPVSDPVWGGEASYGAEDVSANFQWLEGVFGVDAKIWGPVRMGWSFRYKRKLTQKKDNIGNSYYVPGFGKQGGTRLGGTFNVTLEI
jgi:hypothetical protein|uniref:DUF6048 family protein n=1 Tax=Prevotella sp. TaxID=59823 RepID=UPI003FF14851